MQLLIISAIYIMVIESRLVPTTKRRMIRRNNDPVLPKVFFDRGQSLSPSFKIPNQEFCSGMSLKPEDHYKVLPWWYHYCQDLRENLVKNKQGKDHFSAAHLYILNELQAYKKRMKAKQLKKMMS
ncbi:hypothetical protein HW555_012073 [Spodoptera exigua]|uniref:Uncharacterized protein n=1 Tax=Spodoptera exigua TaxID=7107 RepID=A0A835G7S5_SPOEX|nr:hypothetical protein HW555_012073 [Spodoptera exigua]